MGSGSGRCGGVALLFLRLCYGGLEENSGGTAANAGQGGDAHTGALEFIEPHFPARGGVEAIGVSHHGNDEAVAIEKERDESFSVAASPLPDDVAGVTMEGHHLGMKPDEYEILEHGLLLSMQNAQYSLNVSRGGRQRHKNFSLPDKTAHSYSA